MIAVTVTHGIKPVEVEGKTYALEKGDSAFIPSKLAGAMIKRGWAAKIPKPERLGEIDGAEVSGIRHKEETGEDNSAVEEATEKEAVNVREELDEEEINGTAALDYKDWTVIKEGIVENSQAANYKSGVKLEQNGSFFRIIVKGCYPRGYTTKEEAVKRYEELTEVK